MAPPNESGFIKRAIGAMFPRDSSDNGNKQSSTSIEGILRDPANQGKKRKRAEDAGAMVLNMTKETPVPAPKLPINSGPSNSSSHSAPAFGLFNNSPIKSGSAVQPEKSSIQPAKWETAFEPSFLHRRQSDPTRFQSHHHAMEATSNHMYSSEEYEEMDEDSDEDENDSHENDSLMGDLNDEDDNQATTDLESTNPYAETSNGEDNLEVVSDISSITHSRHVLRADGGRPYNTWILDNGRSILTYGALLPSEYQLYDDPSTPWICPIRSCRLLFARLEGLGGHFNSKHRAVELNDNRDGTFSEIRSYSGEGRTPAIVTTKGPASSHEPPMPDPTLPQPKNGKKVQVQKDNSSKIIKNSLRREKRSKQVVGLNSLAKPSTVDHSGKSANSRALTTWNTLVWPHLQNTPSSPIPSTGYVPYLLPLSVQRSLVFNHKAPVYFERKTQDISALIIQITGVDAPEPCTKCKEGRGPFSGCVVISPDAPLQVRKHVTSCANCFYKGNQSRCSGLVEWRKESDPNQSEGQKTVTPAEEISSDSGIEAPTPRRSKRTGKDVDTDSRTNSANQNESDSTSEMSEWEIAPGRGRNESGPETENFIYSTAYMTHGTEVRINSQTRAYNLSIKPGTTHQFSISHSHTRICFNTSGKVRVKDSEKEYGLGRGGMFVIKPGTSIAVKNRRYNDATLNIVTIQRDDSE
ncbi:hypothetical protein PFICI_01645 [Pestalotiopsis fici W106-1]|uniref:Uncharacterized protein n=1 Tax=Pestalotiopsis fici (strain W106-1 / CGMCC3.15140) TaxID=1229662 RepID=W3XQM5_PESFW|nr:uncharacterized protein PFICI_01645 [Pestalotiopsis fici W106-1]ETS87817.1 hypothetical protein PFICI_01645 [Pestalotiopsis fici W106-1]